MTEDDQDLLERMEALIANAWDDDEHETLVEARDRIKDLIAENEHLKDVYSSATECFLEADAENERLREALVWAANVDPDLVSAIRVHAALGKTK